MAPIFAGALTTKKKDELASIATAAGIDDGGKRDELLARVKQYLDDNADDLEDNPQFKGLIKSRRGGRSSQPPEEPKKRKSTGRRVTTLDVVEETPHKERDMRNVSMLLKQADEEDEVEEESNEEGPEPPRTRASTSAVRSAPNSPVLRKPVSSRSAKNSGETTLRVPEPQSAVVHPNEPSISAIITARVLQNVDFDQVRGFTTRVRSALSSSIVIFWTTVLLELFSIKWKFEDYHQVPFQVPSVSAFVLFQAYLLPSLVLPYLAGKFISFRTTKKTRTAWDPLTASIIRLAAHMAIGLYFIPGNVSQTLSASPPVPTPGLLGLTKEETLDVDAGVRWRILTSGIALAFAFAEVAQAA